jgi:hypothetical protein
LPKILLKTSIHAFYFGPPSVQCTVVILAGNINYTHIITHTHIYRQAAQIEKHDKLMSFIFFECSKDKET